MNIKQWITGSALAFTALVSPITASAVQVVNINADPNPTAAGSALINAIANITDNSAAKPYLITMDPGTYDVGDFRVQLKSFVDIQGSGQANTIIQGNGNTGVGDLLNGVLKGANSLELRNLQIKCIGGVGRNGIALYNGLASPTLRNVTIVASGGDSNWGIRNNGSSPLIEDSKITSSGGSNAYGIVNTSSTAAQPTIRRTSITASGATSAYGIYNDLQGMPVDVRDTKITASGTTTAYGFYLTSSNGGNIGNLLNSTLSVSGATTNYGVYFTGLSTDTLTIDNTIVTASGGTSSYGVNASTSGLTIRHSSITGATRSVKSLSNFPKIGLTQLAGAFEPSGALACAGVYDGSLTFFAGPACP